MEKDSIDLKYAKEVADFIGSDHVEVIMTKEDVLGSLDEVVKQLETWDITTVSPRVGLRWPRPNLRRRLQQRIPRPRRWCVPNPPVVWRHVLLYEARFLASAISASAGTTKLIDLPANAGVMNVPRLAEPAMDAAVTLDVGTSGTAAKYASAMAMDATGLLFADSLSKGSESATAITPLYIKKSGATTVGDITVRITIQARS